MKFLRMIIFTLLFVMVAALIAGCTGRQEASIELKNTSGEIVHIFPGDQPALIFFFTTAGCDLCKKQLTLLKENVKKFNDMDVNIYAVSSDTMKSLKYLHDELEPPFPFLSDPEFKLIEHMNMRNDTVPYRGYGMLDKKGKVIFTKKDNHWAEHMTETSNVIHQKWREMKK
ncbi:redoxin domain-containing protein [Fictibacillus gelatini]|uniref:redoxin domain-containing protein n=1 Tax=Fictibacillus gelatini TaxID=225985 RepID=UPI0003F830DF|nr:redoxin domain-containing protein [Fictibacillus gelatini]